jgi:hypothetical protein
MLLSNKIQQEEFYPPFCKQFLNTKRKLGGKMETTRLKR